MWKKKHYYSTIKRSYTSFYHLKFKNLNTCIYCGEFATERDHIMPICYIQGIELWRPNVYKQFLPHGFCVVPSCGSCNRTAGGKGFTKISIKRDYIQNKLRKKYRKLLKALAWEEEELREIEGYVLRSGIRALENQSRRLMRRVNWPYSRKWKELDLGYLNEKEEKKEKEEIKKDPIDRIVWYKEEEIEEEIEEIEEKEESKMEEIRKNVEELEILKNRIKKLRKLNQK